MPAFRTASMLLRFCILPRIAILSPLSALHTSRRSPFGPSRGPPSSKPIMRSTRVPVHLTSPVARSRPSNMFPSSEVGCHAVPRSSRFTKKSLVSASGRPVLTPGAFQPGEFDLQPACDPSSRIMGSGANGNTVRRSGCTSAAPSS